MNCSIKAAHFFGTGTRRGDSFCLQPNGSTFGVVHSMLCIQKESRQRRSGPLISQERKSNWQTQLQHLFHGVEQSKHLWWKVMSKKPRISPKLIVPCQVLVLASGMNGDFHEADVSIVSDATASAVE